jgi:hypothetical protein
VRHGKRCVRVTHCPYGTTEVGGRCITITKPHDHEKVRPPHDHEKVRPPRDHEKIRPPRDHRKVRPPRDRGKSHVTPHYDHGKVKAGSRIRPPGAGGGGHRGGGRKGKRER